VTALYIRFHRWRGVTLFNSEPDLFSHVFRLGFVTVYVCRQCLLEAYRKLRRTIEEVVRKDGEGR
jgi:hypothetical protein